MVDLSDLTARVLAIRRGELDPSAVSDDELREALQQQRAAFSASAPAAKAAKTKKSGGMDFDFSNASLSFNTDSDKSSGGLF